MNAPISGRTSVRPVESYRPPDSAQHEWLRELLREYPLPGSGRFGCYFISDSSSYSDLARAVECAVFQHYFGNDPQTMAVEYGDYEESSRFLLVVDREERRPAGTLRVIDHSDNGFKTLNDITREPLSLPIEVVRERHNLVDLEHCWDIGTLAVLSPYRGASSGHTVSTLLYGHLHQQALRFGIQQFIAILDTHAYNQLTQLLGVPFVPICDSQPFAYLGSPSSIASYLHLPDVFPAVEAFTNSLDANTYALLQPYLARVVYREGLPDAVDVA